MAETAKERIYRGALETMSDSDFMGNKYVKKFVKGVFKQIEDVPATTDKLSVEKLQEHLLPYSKEMVQKIRDEKMQLVTADEFVKLHKESLTAIRENDKLQEQHNTAKKYIEHAIGTIKHDGHLGTIQTDWILPYLEKTLAAIENEGSGDE